MKKLLNTLYVTLPDSYLALKGSNVNILQDGQSLGRIPLHNLEAICAYGYQGVSPALMERCVEDKIALVFLTKHGRFQARVTGPVDGNVTLRKTQYRFSDDREKSATIASMMLIGKVHNARKNLERLLRDHALRVDGQAIQEVVDRLKTSERALFENEYDLEELLGVEGQAASLYFGRWNDWILNQKETFVYQGRTRRPPLDPLNAILSFAYTLLAAECQAALEAVGLDAYVGFLHRDRPGRASLALDVMEELRPIVDRFVIKLINQRQLTAADFTLQENGAVLLTDDARRRLLQRWQEEKEEEIRHPYLKEKIKKGLLPHVQALLLARYIRSDLDAYPPYLQ